MALNQAILSNRFNKNVDVALNVERWHGSSDCADAVIDLHKGSFGLSIKQSLTGSTTKIGTRMKLGNFTAYTTVPLDGGPRLYGLTHQKHDLEIDVAYLDNQATLVPTFIRASYWRGNVVPELRLKFSHEENIIGFALAYYPH